MGKQIHLHSLKQRLRENEKICGKVREQGALKEAVIDEINTNNEI